MTCDHHPASSEQHAPTIRDFQRLTLQYHKYLFVFSAQESSKGKTATGATFWYIREKAYTHIQMHISIAMVTKWSCDNVNTDKLFLSGDPSGGFKCPLIRWHGLHGIVRLYFTARAYGLRWMQSCTCASTQHIMTLELLIFHSSITFSYVFWFLLLVAN